MTDVAIMRPRNAENENGLPQIPKAYLVHISELCPVLLVCHASPSINFCQRRVAGDCFANAMHMCPPVSALVLIHVVKEQQEEH